MAISSKESFDQWLREYRWLESKVLEIYRYVNNDQAYRLMLRFNRSIFDKFEILEECIRIYYIDYDERDCVSYIDISFENIYKNTWQECISSIYKEWKRKYDERQYAIKQANEEKERELFEKLKRKYEPYKELE